MVDYLRTARLLRVKAADPAVPDPEKRALLERATALEAKYGNGSSPSTNDTTTTSRDGFTWNPPTYMWTSDGRFNPFARPPGFDQKRYEEAVRQTENLFRNQHMWNRPPEEEDIVEEGYQTQPEDEDYGYDIYEGEPYS